MSNKKYLDVVTEQRYVDVVNLAKEIEIWAAGVRYRDNNINEKISLESVYHLNRISTGQIVVSNDLEQISYIIKNFEEVEKAPDHIRNKLLLLNAFYSNKYKTPEITGTLPQPVYHTTQTVLPTEIKVEFARSTDWDGPFCSVK